MSARHRVLVADDDALLRSSLAELVGSDAGLELVAVAADGAQAVESALRERIDLALLDIRMPVLDGIEATRRILAARPATGVVLLTTFDLDEYVFAALRAGAAGFLLKSAPVGEVLRALHTVASGQAMLAPEVTRRLIGHFAAPPQPATGPDWASLTPREQDLVQAVVRGLSNEELAAELFLSPATVKSYLSRLFDKVGVRDRTQLVILAYEAGWVSAGRPRNGGQGFPEW